MSEDYPRTLLELEQRLRSKGYLHDRHEPQSVLGQISILATHPITIARAFARKLLRR